jgi:hypothetical protein
VIPQTLTRTALWLSLGSWVGSWGFFAFVVSRVAFRVLPGDVAGDLAGMLLATLHWSGAVMALVAAWAAWALGRRGGLVGFPILLALLCAASELWLSPEVASLRPSSLGAAASEETSQRFGFLHALSLGLFLAIHLASCVLVVWHARLDARLGARVR